MTIKERLNNLWNSKIDPAIRKVTQKATPIVTEEVKKVMHKETNETLRTAVKVGTVAILVGLVLYGESRGSGDIFPATDGVNYFVYNEVHNTYNLYTKGVK